MRNFEMVLEQFYWPSKPTSFLAGKNPAFVRTLAAAYAEFGQFDKAINAAERALKLSIAQGDSALANDLRFDIDLYRLKLPRRDAP